MPGDTAGFARIIAQLEKLEREGAEQVARAIAAEALRQAQACFRESRNPYGEPWAPLKHRHGKPLQDTGRLRASLAISAVSKAGFRIGTNVAYAGYHQQGVDETYARKASSRFQPVNQRGRFLSKAKAGKTTTRAGVVRSRAIGFRRLDFKAASVHLVIPQRAFLPLRGRGIGAIWEPAFTRAALLAIERITPRAA